MQNKWLYDELPSRYKETSTGIKVRACPDCGERCYVFYDEDRKYRVECEHCDFKVEFKISSFDKAVELFNEMEFRADCEHCPLGWEDRGYEGECYDCGCMVKEDIEWCRKTYDERLEKTKEFDEQ